MLEDKAMIIIAVSKYAGAYGNLPGAITSANRLRIWAEDEGYKVLYLADDVFDKIDVQLVRQEVSRFVNNNFIDRLVVYFAGHGIVRSLSNQFWLLTEAAKDLQEGIDVDSFQKGLLKCNIGNNDFAGQLCIIGDACRNIARDAIEFLGDPILTSTERTNRNIQLDRFLSTRLGGYSFQINEIGNQSAYCLFSEVMLSALRGEVKEAIETEFHKFKPVVTNHKLADYLEKEVKNRAAAIQEEMMPDVSPAIRPPYNFYKRLQEPLPDVIASPQDRQVVEAIHMAIRDSQAKDSNDQLTEVQERRKQTLLRWKRDITLESIQSSRDRANPRWLNDGRPNFSITAFSDFQPKSVAVPESATVEIHLEKSLYEILTTNCDDSPILINQGEQWILIPNYPHVTPMLPPCYYFYLQ